MEGFYKEDLSDDDKDDDDEWVPLPREKRSKSRKGKKNQRKKGKKIYGSFDDVSDSESDTEDQHCNSRSSFLYANELHQMDLSSSVFSHSLIAIKFHGGKSHTTKGITLKELLKMPKKVIRSIFCEITIMRRARYGKIYIFKGFRDCLHFTIGEKAMKLILDAFNDIIPVYILNGKCDELQPDHVEFSSKRSSKKCDIDEALELLTKVAKMFVPHILANEIPTVKRRVKHSINLGITDQKVSNCFIEL